MKNIVVFLFILTLFASYNYPPRFEKKLNNIIKKTWNITDFEKKQVEIPDSLNIGYSLYLIENNNYTLGYFLINKINACKKEGCERPDSTNRKVEYENFYTLIIYDYNFEIKQLKILEYNAKKGEEIENKNWLKQFYGKSGCNLQYGKTIDAVSGATTSAVNLINNTKQLCKWFQQLRDLDII